MHDKHPHLDKRNSRAKSNYQGFSSHGDALSLPPLKSWKSAQSGLSCWVWMDRQYPLLTFIGPYENAQKERSTYERKRFVHPTLPAL